VFVLLVFLSSKLHFDIIEKYYIDLLDNAINFTFYSIILLFSFCTLWYYLSKLSIHYFFKIRALNKVIKECYNKEDDKDKFLHLEREIPYIENAFFKNIWWEYQSTIVRTSDNIYKTSKAEVNFNIDTLLVKKTLFINRCFIIPNLLTGLGILGTCVGLV
jgi:hypothetical protein